MPKAPSPERPEILTHSNLALAPTLRVRSDGFPQEEIPCRTSIGPRRLRKHRFLATQPTQHEIIGTEDLAVVKLASLVGIAAQSLLRICAMGELDFVAWRELLNQRLTVLGHSVSEEEIEWLEEHLPYEPTLKACIRAARQNLNDRLRSEPALPARATISLFMHGGIEEDVVTFRADELGTPTAAIILQEPLHFLCHRGAIYQFDECQVEAQLSVDLLPAGLGTPSLERERFVLQSESDFSCINGIVSLRYPS